MRNLAEDLEELVLPSPEVLKWVHDTGKPAETYPGETIYPEDKAQDDSLDMIGIQASGDEVCREGNRRGSTGVGAEGVALDNRSLVVCAGERNGAPTPDSKHDSPCRFLRMQCSTR
jgi:hypothetical protein